MCIHLCPAHTVTSKAMMNTIVGPNMDTQNGENIALLVVEVVVLKVVGVVLHVPLNKQVRIINKL